MYCMRFFIQIYIGYDTTQTVWWKHVLFHNPWSYVQFIPLYTSRENTSYEYSISIDDKNAWFDAYFVPSKEQLGNYLTSDAFYHYPDNNCFANSYQSFTGICNDVGKNSGLLIVIPDSLDKSLTKVRVNLHEMI